MKGSCWRCSGVWPSRRWPPSASRGGSRRHWLPRRSMGTRSRCGLSTRQRIFAGGVGGACLSCVPVRLCRAGIFDLDPQGLEGSTRDRQNNQLNSRLLNHRQATNSGSDGRHPRCPKQWGTNTTLRQLIFSRELHDERPHLQPRQHHWPHLPHDRQRRRQDADSARSCRPTGDFGNRWMPRTGAASPRGCAHRVSASR